MPSASSSLLFTWCIESVLMGLVALLFASNDTEKWIAWTLLGSSLLTFSLQLANSAAATDLAHEVAMAHHCVMVGLLLVNLGLRSFALAFVIAYALVSVAMVLSATQGPTPLCFHRTGHAAVLVILVLKSGAPIAWLLAGAVAVAFGVMGALDAPPVRLLFHCCVSALAVLLLLSSLVGGLSWGLATPVVMVVTAAGWLAWEAYSYWEAAPTGPPSAPPAPPQSASVAAAFRDVSFRELKIRKAF